MKVFKYPIPFRAIHNDGQGDYFILDMPEGAEPLAVQMQDGTPTMWAKVHPDAQIVERRFYVCGTGHDIHPGAGRHVGTFQVLGMVFHVFEDSADAYVIANAINVEVTSR